MGERDFAIISAEGGDTLITGESLTDTWERIDEGMLEEHEHAVVLVEFDGYSEIELLEGRSLEEVRRKLGEKAGVMSHEPVDGLNSRRDDSHL